MNRRAPTLGFTVDHHVGVSVLWATIVGVVFLNERVTPREIGAGALGLAGVWLACGRKGEGVLSAS